MRIVHLITDLATGGAEMMLYKLLSRLEGRGFRSQVISLMDGGPVRDRIEGLGIAVDSLGMKPRWPTPAEAARLVRAVRRRRPDIVQGWMFHGCLATEFVRLFLDRKPVVWNIRHSLHDLSGEKPMRVAVIRWLAHLSSRPVQILYNSRTSAKQHEGIGYNPRRTLVVPNGFDCEIFRPDPQARLAVRQELGLGAGALLIGLAARVSPVKDHPTFLEAAGRLGSLDPPVHFVLMGRGADHSNRALESQIRSQRLEGRIHLLGERQDMPRLTAALDLATCCSVAESFPNVLGEAMACGVPCVATNVGDTAWIIGETGRVVPTRSPAALSQAWQELLAMGAEGRRSLGEAARQRIAQEFSLDRIAGEYQELYEQLGRG
ncbi:MAG TPA: glycosyltransferase [Bryobacterales bacterium]|nr:glycosyltransferase [Bryobacterales bacterium]